MKNMKQIWKIEMMEWQEKNGQNFEKVLVDEQVSTSRSQQRELRDRNTV